MMRMVLKLVCRYTDSKMYWLTIRMYLAEINALNTEETDLFTSHPIFNLISPFTFSNDLQVFCYSFVDHINTEQYLQIDLV